MLLRFNSKENVVMGQIKCHNVIIFSARLFTMKVYLVVMRRVRNKYEKRHNAEHPLMLKLELHLLDILQGKIWFDFMLTRLENISSSSDVWECSWISTDSGKGQLKCKTVATCKRRLECHKLLFSLNRKWIHPWLNFTLSRTLLRTHFWFDFDSEFLLKFSFLNGTDPQSYD